MASKYAKRASVIFVTLLCVYAVIIANLWYLQLWNADFFRQLGSQQYHATITQEPPRAPIYDRTGSHLLAMNKECVSAFIIPNKIKEPERLNQFLHDQFPQAYARYQNSNAKYFMYVKRKLSDSEQEIIKKHGIQDIHLLKESARAYPAPASSTIIGLTDMHNEGLFGVERLYNSQLRGTSSTYCLEKDARSGYFYFKKETKVQGQSGTPVQLTIDSDLQFLVDQELVKAAQKIGAKEGSVVIIDPSSGQVLAVASYPSFDPSSTHNLVMEHTRCRAVTQSYECGSVFKIFTALAALEEGVVTPDELIDCKNSKTAYLDGRRINTWKPHGIVPFSEIIAQSNNIGIAIVAKRLDTKLYDHLTRLGFGKKTGIELLGEAQGFVNHPSRWSKQSIISLSYGYESMASVLQLASAFCTIANDGVYVKPTIIHSKNGNPPQATPLYSAEHTKTIKNILAHTTQHGTARRAAIKGYRVMSKTGTANIVHNGQYDKDKNMYTCAGIIEKGEYQRVIVTCLREAEQKNLYAAGVAAPLCEQVAEKLIIHERVA